MPRPQNERLVQHDVGKCSFKPDGVPASELEHVVLGRDEAEAIRLADLDGLYQEAAALRMGISRQTFGRIVESGRRKVADALINRKCLRIEGGEIVLSKEGDRKMKIAVPAREGMVDAHFGHADHFTVYSIGEDKGIAAEETVQSEEGCGCKSGIALTLARMGVTHLVAGNMGEGAMRVLNANGIEVARGATGEARAAAELFAAGKFVDTGAACAGHEHGHGHGPGHAQGLEHLRGSEHGHGHEGVHGA
jgi:predicted DNA-binding protein (UPF0251 family)/predicted Fe-Mo cluster-binding NifX family protein